jgi:hypothetical protein
MDNSKMVNLEDQENYDVEVTATNARLEVEAKEHGDVVLVDMVDVYHHLPKKLKLGYVVSLFYLIVLRCGI